jgi:hypothetical protein
MDRSTELFFPHRFANQLRDLAGPQWQALVDRVSKLPATHEDSLALTLMVIRASGCVGCEAGSYRAGLGCVVCAQRAIRAMNASDSALLRRFKRAQVEVQKFLEDTHHAQVDDKAA